MAYIRYFDVDDPEQVDWLIGNTNSVDAYRRYNNGFKIIQKPFDGSPTIIHDSIVAAEAAIGCRRGKVREYIRGQIKTPPSNSDWLPQHMPS